MNNITESFQSFEREVTHAWGCCATAIHHSCDNISEAYETGKRRVVQLAYEHLPEVHADIIRRILDAIPEVFLALSSFVGGVVTLPALVISYVRKCEALVPIIKTVINGDMSGKALGEALEASLHNFDEMFERVLVPSLLVAFTVDAIYCFAMGWLAHDWSKMLHGTVIAVPGAFLALRHILQQRHTQPAQPLPPLAEVNHEEQNGPSDDSDRSAPSVFAPLTTNLSNLIHSFYVESPTHDASVPQRGPSDTGISLDGNNT